MIHNERPPGLRWARVTLVACQSWGSRIGDVEIEDKPRDAADCGETDEALETAVAETRLADDDVSGILARTIIDPIIHAELLRVLADGLQLLVELLSKVREVSGACFGREQARGAFLHESIGALVREARVR